MMKTNTKRILCGWAIGLMELLALPVLGNTYYVATNGNHTTFINWATAATNIQAALDFAADNDIIWVTNGTYTATGNQVVALTNRTLRSMNGYPSTFIDGNNARRCIRASGDNALVDGFTITNGNAAGIDETSGAGVRVVTGKSTIQNCLIIGCTAGAGGQGGGVLAYGSCIIRNCIITGNRTDYMGGGASSYYGGTIENCLIFNNSASNSGASLGQGGGVWMRADGKVRNCTIVSNYASGNNGGGGLNVDYQDSAGTVQNCIIWSNQTAGTGKDAWNGSTNVNFTNSCIEYIAGAGGYGRYGTNNISSNPQFVDFAGGNFRLAANSPCVNAGVNQSWMTNDLDGRTRIRYSTVDMGAYERINDGTVYGIR